MTRTLTFDDSEKSRDRFSMLYQGFNAGGQYKYARDVKPMTATRIEVRLLDKFEEISDAAPTATPNAALLRSLKKNNGPQVVALNEEEYQTLKSYFDCASGAFVPLAAKQVVDTADWLGAIPQEDEKAP